MTSDYCTCILYFTIRIWVFAECQELCRADTRQSPAVGNELVYLQDTRHRNTLGKDIFAERRTLGEGGSRQRAVSGRLKLTIVNLCRGPRVGTRQRVPTCWHSAKLPSPSPRRRDGGFYLSSTAWHSAKSVPSVREKVLGKEGFADVLCAESSLSSVISAKPVPSVFQALPSAC
jgi:hypothetical protein